MKRMQCELCNSLDFQRTDEGFFQCQMCGCKYTIEQAKTLLGQTVETTIGNSELNRRVENAKAQMKIGQPAQETINSIIKDFPASWQGYWLYLENCFKNIFEGKMSLYELEKDNYNSLLTIAKHSTDISEKQASVMWDSNFRKIYDELFNGNIPIDVIYNSFTTKCTSLHPLIKKAYDIGYNNAKILTENGITLYSHSPYNGDGGTLLYGEGGNTILFALGKTVECSYFDSYFRSYFSGNSAFPAIITNENIGELIYRSKHNRNELLQKTNKCPLCGSPLKKILFSSNLKCLDNHHYCGQIYEVYD